MDEEERRRRIRRRRRREEIRRKKRRILYTRIGIAAVAVFAAVLVCVLIINAVKGRNKNISTAGSSESSGDVTSGSVTAEPATSDTLGAGASFTELIAEADRLAAGYDYDGAIAKIQSNASYESDASLKKAISGYTEAKSKCVAVDVDQVPHVFYHSLLNDDRGFIAAKSSEFIAQDNGCWMCSVNEFNTITQQMYDHGCVLIRMRDLVNETTDADGTVHFTKNESLMLPSGKTAVIMSEDDLCYYHAYDDQGIASKLVLDDNGDVKCEYTDENGQTSVGNYDIVPLMNAFIEEHPDFSYHNAHIIEALTGYNGVFGYRTDSVYKTRDPERLGNDQKAWLDAHPDFDYDKEVADATKIANALKSEGYEFASHTWGHRHADQISAEELQVDNEKWVDTVKPIVGDVDTIIFAHGGDIAGIEEYTADNPKYAYFNSAGYHFYANVDGSTPSWIQIRDGYVRTARIDIDGYRLYQAMTGNEASIADMNVIGVHDIDTFFDKNRITPVVIPE